MLRVQRVFISYETVGGKALAEAICERLEADSGIKCWYWHRDRRSGAYTWDEIAEELVASDLAVILCSEGTKASNGQKKEINTVNNIEHPLVVAVVELDMRPASLLWCNADLLSDGIDSVCKKWLGEWSLPVDVVTTSQPEGAPVK